MTLKLTSVNGSSKGCPLPTPTGPSTALSPACLGEGEGYSIYNKQVWAVEFPDGDTGWEPSPIIIILNVIYMSFLCQSHLGSSPKDHAGKFHCQHVPEVLISKVQGVLIKKSSFSALSPARIKSVQRRRLQPSPWTSIISPGHFWRPLIWGRQIPMHPETLLCPKWNSSIGSQLC